MKNETSLKRGYMDGIDFEDELGVAAGGNVVYPSVDNLKASAKHDVSDCGVAEVEVSFIRWIEEPTPVAEIVERHKRSVGEGITENLDDAAPAEESRSGTSSELVHSEHGTVVQPDEAALIVGSDGELTLAFPRYEDDEKIPETVALLAAVLVRVSDEEWVAEQMEYFENLD